ncbi:hypothetical protein ABEB36_004210 [Hypothenemus hampei]|uniref:RAP domain-containing protein n=1 Tax=Hypothenemus hampei TaxID=57062 RepID=A0ABD1F400_HYPHA
MINFYKSIILQQSKSIKWIPSLTWYNGFASATIAEVKNINTSSLSEEDKPVGVQSKGIGKDHKMIKSVFASLQIQDKSSDIQTPFTDNKLVNAQTIDELLSVSQGTGVSRKHALKVLSILSTWASSGKVSFNEFENDPRFLRLCKILTKNGQSSKLTRSPHKSDDLSAVLNVTADDEAAQLVSGISLAQMIRVFTTLSIKRRRSTLLLRTLAFNVASSKEQLDIKQCADLFYSISSLNFYDENLFEKAANDVIQNLQEKSIGKSAVVGSVLTSVGLLKYKNPLLLDAISEWMVLNQKLCRPSDIFSMFMTLGVLNYTPFNSEALFKVFLPQLTEQEAGKPIVWLEIVWSLVLLNIANSDHLKSVLNDAFINKLEETKVLHTSTILKLLNIDGAAEYIFKNYTGPKISKDHDIRNTTLKLSKEKSIMVDALIEALKSLIPESYFKKTVNTGLGFCIDAECAVDSTCNPLPLSEVKAKQGLKIALLALDYHDICKGKMELTGLSLLIQRLLSAMGYHTVLIPHTEFKSTDKIVNKVQYLENRLKEVVKL